MFLLHCTLSNLQYGDLLCALDNIQAENVWSSRCWGSSARGGGGREYFHVLT